MTLLFGTMIKHSSASAGGQPTKRNILRIRKLRQQLYQPAHQPHKISRDVILDTWNPNGDLMLLFYRDFTL